MTTTEIIDEMKALHGDNWVGCVLDYLMHAYPHHAHTHEIRGVYNWCKEQIVAAQEVEQLRAINTNLTHNEQNTGLKLTEAQLEVEELQAEVERLTARNAALTKVLELAELALAVAPAAIEMLENRLKKAQNWQPVPVGFIQQCGDVGYEKRYIGVPVKGTIAITNEIDGYSAAIPSNDNLALCQQKPIKEPNDGHEIHP